MTIGWRHQLNGHESKQTLKAMKGSEARLLLGVAKADNVATEQQQENGGTS